MVSVSPLRNFFTLARSFIPCARSVGLTNYNNLRYQQTQPTQKPSELSEDNKSEKEITKTVINQVNELVEKKAHGRLFAVIQVTGRQFKVSYDDIVVVQGTWAPNIGDKIRLEKVLLVGSQNFTLVGRPILPLDQVAVYATVIEKTLSHTVTFFRFIKRKRCRRTHLSRIPHTYLRINDIQIMNKINHLGDTDGFKDKIF